VRVLTFRAFSPCRSFTLLRVSLPHQILQCTYFSLLDRRGIRGIAAPQSFLFSPSGLLAATFYERCSVAFAPPRIIDPPLNTPFKKNYIRIRSPPLRSPEESGPPLSCMLKFDLLFHLLTQLLIDLLLYVLSIREIAYFSSLHLLPYFPEGVWTHFLKASLLSEPTIRFLFSWGEVFF